MSISDQMLQASNDMHQQLMDNDPSFRDGVLSIHLQSIRDCLGRLDTLKHVLSSYGYTWHVVTPDHGDTVTVAVHPLYLDLFHTHYDPFAKFPPELNIPDWAAIMF